MTIEVNNESGVAIAEGVDEADIVSCCRFTLAELRIHPLAELSVQLVDPDAIAALHDRWMDDPAPTDVMSFPMDELTPPRGDEEQPQGCLGDIVLCPVVATTQAATAGHTVSRELRLLTIHGILHLVGYDHAEPDEEAEMFALQNTLLLAYESHAAQPL